MARCGTRALRSQSLGNVSHWHIHREGESVALNNDVISLAGADQVILEPSCNNDTGRPQPQHGTTQRKYQGSENTGERKRERKRVD